MKLKTQSQSFLIVQDNFFPALQYIFQVFQDGGNPANQHEAFLPLKSVTTFKKLKASLCKLKASKGLKSSLRLSL